jgi:ferredoxin
MRIPGFSFWALVTAVIMYAALSALPEMPPTVYIGVPILWYLIGVGVASAVHNFHFPTYEGAGHGFAGMAVSPGTAPPGTYAVTFANQARTVFVPQGGNLLKAAKDQGVAMYFDINKYVNCFGNGFCGTCRFSVDPKNAAALSDTTWQERFTLGGDAGKMRLACQTNVNGDCTIDNTVAEEFGEVQHYAVINNALLAVFTLVMLGLIIWMGGDMIGLL